MRPTTGTDRTPQERVWAGGATPAEVASPEASLEAAILRHARHSLGRDPGRLTRHDVFRALGLALRDRLLDGMLSTRERFRRHRAKYVYYLSIEYLIGRSLENNLVNLQLMEPARRALSRLGHELGEVVEEEPDAALGNGGLGRLAACFLDSMATLDIPAVGYGIHYEYGLFQQAIHGGYQKERPDNWLIRGTPWGVEQPEDVVYVPVYGRVEHATDLMGSYNPMWLDFQLLAGVPHDFPVAGHGGRTVNVLRLFAARSLFELDLAVFNSGDYIKAVEDKIATETISKVLYPSDIVRSGQELRLLQEYFLVACAMRDILGRFAADHSDIDHLPRQVAVQLNDTHPTLAVPELMRILVDERSVAWERAWEITQEVMGYTNHTLLPEALEKWPVALFERVLPRHLQIIYEINRRFLDDVSGRWPGDVARARRMSLIEEEPLKQVRMAHLAIAGSHSINGVSALHSELVKTTLVPDFATMWPERFNSKTNGVTQRRWLMVANPGLSALIDETIGHGWARDLRELKLLEAHANDPAFGERFRSVKRHNKERLAAVIKATTGTSVDPASLFDIHAKRIHEYKRQLLNVMHIVDRYLSLVDDGIVPAVGRTFVFAGKAAPGYWAAKQLIKLVHDVAGVVNSDHRASGLIRVAFVPDYRVTLAQRIIPAADLSEQISTAGKEASGTGNMKFALNGALTIGTLDGANIEMLEDVGADNMFIFGLTADAIERMRRDGSYKPREVAASNPRLARVVDALSGDRFSPDSPGLHGWVAQKLLERGDEYFHLADLGSYLATHRAADELFGDVTAWTRKAILNVARMGRFSSDRTILEYARGIWGVGQVPPRPADDEGAGPPA